MGRLGIIQHNTGISLGIMTIVPELQLDPRINDLDPDRLCTSLASVCHAAVTRSSWVTKHYYLDCEIKTEIHL
jgi:hypothetical protein